MRYEEDSEDGNTFTLTDLYSNKVIRRSRDHIRQQKIRSEMEDEPGRKSTVELPQLPSEKRQRADSLQHSWSVGLQKKRRSHHYGGLVDPTAMVREKEQIMARKITNTTRLNLFPPVPLPKHIVLRNLNDLQAETESLRGRASPAHSKRFMEAMLMKILKKAGYDESVDEVDE